MRTRQRLGLVLALAGSSLLMPAGFAQRGRKYKPPPDTSHIEVVVTKKSNGKPISNAAVVFRSTLDGREEGNLEVKTDPDGKAMIDIIPTGSTVRVQVIADGFATFAEEYVVKEPSRSIPVAMLRPREQISAYEDNTGKASERKAGVQEPVKPDTSKQPATPPKPAPVPPSEQNTPSPVKPE